MKELITVMCLFSASLMSIGQCSTVSLSVSSSDTSYVQLYHPGFFNIPSGFANVCEWEVTTTSDEIVFQETTSGDAFEQGLVLFEHSVPISDSLKVSVVIINNIEGIVCTLGDTLFWEEIEVLPGSFIGNWAILSNNGGVEEEITSTDEFASSENSIELFPTLIADYFQIEGDRDLFSLSIFNLNGKHVMTHKNVRSSEFVDISNLPSGTYFVHLWSMDNDERSVKQIIKN